MTRFGPAKRCIAAACLALLPGVQAAQADGSFLKLDRGGDTATAALAQERGRLSYGVAYSDYGPGEETAAHVSFSQPFLFAGAEMSVSAGPVAVYDEEWSYGVRGALDSYRTTPWGSLYLLGEIDSAVNGYAALAQVELGARGLGAEVSLDGSDSYDERAAALTFRLPDTPLTLRAGRRFEAEDYFVGASISTF